jgi:two-component system, OmpR family, sensor histidine kinase KdpD
MARVADRRPTPEALLKRCEAEERSESRGKLKIFLGYASGVGKSFRMLDEGRRRKLRGQDVVVVATQPSVDRDVAELLRGFEVIPPRDSVQAIDVDAVLQRHPVVCLIDGLAYENPPGSRNAQRWEDVEQLLVAGISVITSINLQYIAERQKQVEAIRGKSARESVPEAFIRTADEIEVVDAAPEYCVTHSREGGGRTGVDAAEIEHQLSQLREIALVLAAEVVDHQLEGYLHEQGIHQIYGTHERILVCVTPRSNAELMILRGRRQADRFHGELYVVYVEQDDLAPGDQAMLDRNLMAARTAKAHVEVLHAEDAIAAILNFAAQNGVTQIFVGHSQQNGFMTRWLPNPVERFIMEADGMDVRVFPHQEPHQETAS